MLGMDGDSTPASLMGNPGGMGLAGRDFHLLHFCRLCGHIDELNLERVASRLGMGTSLRPRQGLITAASRGPRAMGRRHNSGMAGSHEGVAVASQGQ